MTPPLPKEIKKRVEKNRVGKKCREKKCVEKMCAQRAVSQTDACSVRERAHGPKDRDACSEKER